ncbi:neprilysin-11 [Drosophila takahashii]|uniref:neprilysin-11 n=1 Tax=Drosophila takahashii TaxID=29030 RepID=UPI00389936C4
MHVFSGFSVLAAIMWIICLLFVPLVASSSNTRLLNHILSHVDEEASACGTFYNFACGKYNMRHIDDSFYDIIQMLDHQMNQKLVKLMGELEENSQSRDFNESSVEAKVLRFYRTCSEVPRNMSSLVEYLKLAPPGEGLTWPQFTPNGSSWPQKPFNWLETLAHLHRYGLTNVFLSIDIVSNPHNASEFRFDLSKPSFAEESQRLNSFVETLALLYIMKVPSSDVVALARKIRKLELSVKILTEGFDYIESGLISLQQLEAKTGINLQPFLEIILGRRITPQFRLLAQDFRYFTALKELMDKQDEAQVVASYIMMRFGMYLLEETTDGKEPIECIANIRRNMNLAASWIYKERFLETSTFKTFNQEINDIFEQLRREFLLQVEHNRLELTASQKRFVDGKAKDIILNIGNLPKTDDLRNFVSRHYADLELSSGDLDYHREHLKLLQFRTQKITEQIHKMTTRREEYFDLPEPKRAIASTSYYVMRQNVIILPLGLLQEPFFLPESDLVFKYSLMGFTLAHQLMNAFDTEGIKIDRSGNDRKFNSQRYDEVVDCLHRDGKRNINERIADNAGLELTYSAYSKNARNRNQFDFTHLPAEKIFFLNLGQFFCGNSDFNVEYEDDQVRLQQVLDGFEPFEKAFGCRRNNNQLENCQMF